MESIRGYCVDSDVLIDYLRGMEAARGFLLESSRELNLYISIISIVELYSGSGTKDHIKKESLNQFLSNFRTIELTQPIAVLAGELRRDFQKPFADSIIAASAISLGLSLVTKNTKHFKDISGLRLSVPY